MPRLHPAPAFNPALLPSDFCLLTSAFCPSYLSSLFSYDCPLFLAPSSCEGSAHDLSPFFSCYCALFLAPSACEGCACDLSPLLSVNCALFCAMEPTQLLSHQSLPHSFPCNGGVGAILAVRDLKFHLKCSLTTATSSDCATISTLVLFTPSLEGAVRLRHAYGRRSYRRLRSCRRDSGACLKRQIVNGQQLTFGARGIFFELSETVNCKPWTVDFLTLAFPVADVQPAGTVALAARHLAVLPTGLARWTNLPVGLVRRTANHSGTPFADSNLGALTVNHLRGVGNGSAAGAYGHGLWLEFSFLVGRRCFLVSHDARNQLQVCKLAGSDSSVSRKWTA